METTHPARTAVAGGLRKAEKIWLIVMMSVSALVSFAIFALGIVGIFMAASNETALFFPAAEQADGFWQGINPHIVDGEYESVALTIAGVESPGMILYSATVLLGVFAVSVFFAFLFYLCLRLYRRQPFGTLITAGFGVTAVFMIAYSLLGPLVLSAAQNQILESMDIDMANAPFTTGYVFAETDALTIIVGLVFALVAGAFHIGHRLQRDTEGLV